ncbi:hypothetical protein [Burkholderia sp. Ac-20365]|jgi:hypothetical protein|nr:hypothetical protein [Burkholderia sp. Ac-20365]MBN3762158.1 hypothetical protein [Burkholderia sp. Ac-20365]
MKVGVIRAQDAADPLVRRISLQKFHLLRAQLSGGERRLPVERLYGAEQ